MPMKIYKHREITEKIIGAAQRVHNTLGYGFLEKVYQNALVIELRTLGFNVDVEQPKCLKFMKFSSSTILKRLVLKSVF
jgi:GxxExxY protein